LICIKLTKDTKKLAFTKFDTKKYDIDQRNFKKQLICSLFYCYKFNTFQIITCKIPLLDKTEARYAEIARIMWDTNQWIMPQIDYGIPFWAKPPLSTWLSAGSYFWG
jgi:hypothetical protein